MTLQFVAAGNAPLMKRTKFTVNGGDQLSVVRLASRPSSLLAPH